jgi:hypothetical protein
MNIMRRFFPLFGWLVLSTLVLAQDHTRRDAHEMHRLHQDPQAYIAILDDPQRDTYQKWNETGSALRWNTPSCRISTSSRSR